MSCSKRRSVQSVWLTTGEVADACGVNRATVVRWIKSGRLTAAVTPGGHHRVRQEDLQMFLASLKAPIDDPSE